MYGGITSAFPSFREARGGVPGATADGTGGGALTSSQAWEGVEPVQVLGYLLPQVFEGAETRGQGGDQGAGHR